jgi:hypothetical protein
MNVLHHGESRWRFDDFDLPPLSVEPSTPLFLQPAHEPQICLPSLFTPWAFNINRLITPIPAATSGFDRRPSFERLNSHGVSGSHAEPVPWNTTNRAILSSSATSDHLVGPVTDQLTLPGIEHSPHTPASNCNYHIEIATLPLKERDDSQQPQYEQPWGSLDYDNTWESEGLAQLDQHEECMISDQQFSPSATHEDIRPESPRLRRRSESAIAISPQHSSAALPETSREGLNMSNGPYPVSIGNPAISMPPPPRKRNHMSLVLEEKAEERGVNASVKYEPEPKRHQSIQALSSKPLRETPSSHKQSQGGGAYVHSLCGKSFAERSKVKKHHWGNKNDDLNTTTGCWHKHKRPNVSWDDHPSCKSVPRPALRNSRRARSATEDAKAPVVPAMVPDYPNVVPGFPTLRDLPRTYREAAESPHTHSSLAKDGPMHNSTLQESYVPYHSHGLPGTILPPSSPFESLLTAVNVAAKIEEPSPKGRNDSVVIYELDAQAIAAERTGQYTPAWAFTSGCQDEYYNSRHYLPSPTDNGFGMGSPSTARYMPLDMNLSRSNSVDYATPNVSPTFSTLVYADQYAFMQSNEGDAAGQGFGLHLVHD